MTDDFNKGLEEKKRQTALNNKGAQLLAFAEAVTGGHFMDSLFPAPKLAPKSLCDSCERNFKEPSFCQSCIKTWYNTTDIVIKTCSGFKEASE